MDIKLRKIEQMRIMLLILSLFLINETFRMMFLYKCFNITNHIWIRNFLFLFVIISYFLTGIKNQKKFFNFNLFFIVTFNFGMILINTFFGNISNSNCVTYFLIYIIPFMLLCINLEHMKTKILFFYFLKYFNIIIILLTMYGILDYLTNGFLQLYMADNFSYGEYSSLIHLESSLQFRMYSPLGHPLHNAKLYLIFYIFNVLYSKYYEKKLNHYFILAITLLGLLLSGSKTALILALFLFIFCNGQKINNYKYYIVVILMLICAFNSTMFKSNLMERFEYGIKNNNLSSGRNQVLEEVVHGNYSKPSIVKSGGVDYSRKVSKLAMIGAGNFEYPLIMLAYDYGILETILMYFLICIYPIGIFIKNKDYFILINFLCLTLYVNSNNGLANFSDTTVVFCFLTMMLINLSKNNKLKKNSIKLNKIDYTNKLKLVNAKIF